MGSSPSLLKVAVFSLTSFSLWSCPCSFPPWSGSGPLLICHPSHLSFHPWFVTFASSLWWSLVLERQMSPAFSLPVKWENLTSWYLYYATFFDQWNINRSDAGHFWVESFDMAQLLFFFTVNCVDLLRSPSLGSQATVVVSTSCQPVRFV